MAHPRNVGWGEIGLDYHYDNSPRDVQREVFSRQLRHAVRLGKPITVHTREADEDTERILKAEVPKGHKVRSVVGYVLGSIRQLVPIGKPQIHIHCFTDLPDFAQRLLDHFPNLYIGITGTFNGHTRRARP
jgi:TatD DNase family protein